LAVFFIRVVPILSRKFTNKMKSARSLADGSEVSRKKIKMWKGAANKVKAVGAVASGATVDDFKVHKQAGWRTAGQVAAIASHHNARKSARISRNSQRAATELASKLEENRQRLAAGKKESKKAGMSVKERIAARKKGAAPAAEGSTGLTDMMGKNKMVDWEEEEDEDEDEEEEKEEEPPKSKRASTSRGINKRSSARGSTSK
jgi:hypothetical protein